MEEVLETTEQDLIMEKNSEQKSKVQSNSTLSKESKTEVDNTKLIEHIEAVLFLSGAGLDHKYLAEKLEATEAEVVLALSALTKKYSGDCGIHLIKYRNNYQFTTNPNYASRVAEVLNPVREKVLTRAALETLAIVAYKQPLTRIDIEEIRGADSSYATQILMQNNLIEVVGRKDAVGKPLLFATTDEFLKRFELENIDGLPSYEELLEKIRIIQTQGIDFDNEGPFARVREEN